MSCMYLVRLSLNETTGPGSLLQAPLSEMVMQECAVHSCPEIESRRILIVSSRAGVP
jgi:hypothetical protein